MKTLAAAIAFMLLAIGPVSAGPLDDAKIAYDRGDYTTAIRIWTPLAKLGNAQAQFSLGVLFADGKGVLKDEKEAVSLYRLAANQGYDPAEYALARMFFKGRGGVARDFAEAVKWFRLAADHGNSDAQTSLGLMYLQGWGIPRNDVEAVKWFRRAAERGDAAAEMHLGEVYEYGNVGVRRDDAEAIKWYKLAADRGNLEAQYRLGQMIENGRGVARNITEAMKWYELAAHQGNASAQFAYGRLLYLSERYSDSVSPLQIVADAGRESSIPAALWLGAALMKLGRPAEAVKSFDECIPIKFCHMGRGLALEQAGKLEWALASYKRAQDERYAPDLEVPPGLSLRDAEINQRIESLKARIAATPISRPAEGSPAAILTGLLYQGRARDAEQQLAAYATGNPSDQSGQFALGIARFVVAIERFGQELYRYGLESPGRDALFGPPFLRFPVPQNPDPEKLTYEAARQMLKTLVVDLAAVEAPLANVSDPQTGIEINLGLVRLDLTSDGKADEQEALWQLLSMVSAQPIDEAAAEQFSLRFDAGDAAWLRGYSDLIAAMAEFLLAYDWHETFNLTLHRFFPRSGLPNSELDTFAGVDTFDRDVIDAITMLHSMHCSVAEPERMKAVLKHLEAVVQMSRLSWRLILAETDDRNEWIPSPSQTGIFPGLPITQPILDGWLTFLDQFEAMLQGKILLGHWRFEKSINLRRVFLQPRQFDPVLWAHGSAALPYLEEGPPADRTTWQRMEQIFSGNFFSYAVWLN